MCYYMQGNAKYAHVYLEQQILSNRSQAYWLLRVQLGAGTFGLFHSVFICPGHHDARSLVLALSLANCIGSSAQAQNWPQTF